MDNERDNEREVGWPCNCGHLNIRKDAKAGHQVIFDVCDECKAGPLDMPTFEEVSA